MTQRFAWALLPLLAACEATPPRPISSDNVRHAEALASPAGAVPRGAAAQRRALRESPPVTAALLKRGARGYSDFCAPSHGVTGAGNGPVIARGFTVPRPLAATDRDAARVATIIGEGYGTMLPMADQIAPAERWAIAAHVARLPQR